MKKIMLTALFGLLTVGAGAQRVTDKLTRGLVAVPQGDKTGQDSRYGTTGTGMFVTWRKLPAEYYNTKYNLYRNGTKIASDLTVQNYQDNQGTATSRYYVVPVVNGAEVASLKSDEVTPWPHQYWDIQVEPVVNRNGATVSGYSLNDCSVADVDGDGQMEFVVKRRNDSGNLNTSSNKTDFNLHECYKMDGTRLWWIDMGPNLMSGPDEQFDLILYDWDQDGKAEAVMRGADNMIIHTSTGMAIKIGNMNYFAPRDEYTHQGNEYLLYLNGETGEPYGWDGQSDTFTPMAYPLPRFEQGETDYASVWGKADTGHRSCKHYFGAPYLDGRNASIFLGRGCYTRHKFCALDVNKETHELTQRWRWNCYDGSSPWFGNGFHNFAIADIDMDGRDEIVFGSMMIDDTGFGLATTGYGHGDAQHCTDLDPYRWGLEQFVCLESTVVPGVAYTDATSQTLYYTSGTGGDNGRAMAGNFQNTYPGSVARSPGCGLLSCASDRIIEGDSHMSSDDNWNMRVYWDGDLLDEFMDSPGVERAPTVYKYGGQTEVGTGRAAYANDRCWMGEGSLNNSSKNNPCFLGDVIGDWREEIVVRVGDNTLRLYTSSFASPWGMTSLWYDHVYRNGMTWQCVGYNQPPQTSFFVGELEGITKEPPALTLEGRTEVANGGTISGSGSEQLLISGYENQTISVTDGAAPAVLTVNAPAWVKGSGGAVQSDGSVKCFAATPKQPTRTIETFTTTLTGGAFAGAMNLVKQGEGLLVLPAVSEKHTGNTDVWNGTLQFDGTLESSPLWLNRHTTLISNGGQFKGGLKADYNATIYPGGKDNVGDIATTELRLGFGSRIVIDINGTAIDHISADKLYIETKTDEAWKNYGPKYLRPVIQFNVIGELATGKHVIGTLGAIDSSEGAGSLSDIIVEGLNTDKVTYLSHEDGKLYFNVDDIRPAATIVWCGTQANSVWDYGVTKNFLREGVPEASVKGDDIIFNDDASSTTVIIAGGVKPNSVTFDNETKTYTLTGDSIVGGGTITKKGAADVTINTQNHTGDTYLQKGKLEVNLLANRSGQTYGALGDAAKTIHMSEGTTLKLNGTIITDQAVNIENNATIEVPLGRSVIFNAGINGDGATVNKTGGGYLQLGIGNKFKKLVIMQGTVESQKSGNLMQVPDTIELRNATFQDFPNENSGFSNRANFVVPQGSTATINGAPYCAYTGTLTGSGTLNIFAGGGNTNLQGDWSEFEGTLVPGLKDRTVKGTTVTFKFQNAKGLPKATLNLGSDVTVNSTTSIELGHITGTGTLAGTGYAIGLSGKDVTASFHSTAPITKRGEGAWRLTSAGNITGAITIEQGALQFSSTDMSTPFLNSLTLKDAGQLEARGQIGALTMRTGSKATPQAGRLTTPGTLKASGAVTIDAGATLCMRINSKTAYSKLEPQFLTMNGTLAIELGSSYKPAKGDEFTLWTVTRTFSGTPTFELPALPEGLYWDTTALTAKTGVLRITDDATVGIGQIAGTDLVSCQLYTVGGTLVGTFESLRSDVKAAVRQLGVTPGLYIVRMVSGRNFSTETVTVK